MSGIDWHLLLIIFGKIATCYGLVMPTAWVREQEGHSVGVRTFPIVAMASCGYLLIIPQSGDLAASSRVLQGLVAGIGFVGGGAILKQGANIHGTSAAASIWNTGAIGAAVALDKYEVAIALAVFNAFTMWALVPLKHKLDERAGKRSK